MQPVQIDKLRAEKCKRSFYFFVQTFWEDVDPEPFIDSWVVKCVCEHLESIERGDISNLIINIPPSMGKSIIVSVMFSAWLWVKNPSNNTLCSTRNYQNLTRDAIKFYNLIKSEKYQSYFGDLFTMGSEATRGTGKKISETIKAIDNSEKGYRRAVTTGAGATGARGKIIILDDPNDRGDAFSEVDRARINEYVFKTLSTRNFAKKGGAMVIVMQRLHEEDVAGVAIEKGYNLLKIPMEYKDGESIFAIKGWADPREDGEFINHELYDSTSKRKTILDMGSLEYETQYMQNPTIQDGDMIKAAWIKNNPLPKDNNGDLTFENDIMTFDLTFKGDSSAEKKGELDFVVGDYWITHKGEFYLVDQVRGKWDFSEQLKQIQWFFDKHRPNKLSIEDAANASAVYSVIQNTIPQVMLWKPQTSKVARVNAVSPLFEALRVNIDRDKFPVTYKETLSFPNAKHDDTVDAMTMALIQLKQGYTIFDYL